MVMRYLTSDMDVVEAGKTRLKTIGEKDVPLYLSISGGKDSICLSHLVYDLIQKGEFSTKNLVVQFIDEEAMYEDSIDIVKLWRKRFMKLGIPFEWYCIQVKHYNCLNSLRDAETYICWDSREKENWIRPMPKWAIKTHPLLREREEIYQTFLEKRNKGGISIIGVRAAESVQRLEYMGRIFARSKNPSKVTSLGKFFPMYDWRDIDVWMYIRDNNLEIPDTYLQLFQVGLPKSRLRISQFFSIDTIRSLVYMWKHNPRLMERIVKREPNAYLASMYWDSVMFQRSSKSEKFDKIKNYQKTSLDYINNNKNFETDTEKQLQGRMRHLLLKYSCFMSEKHWKRVYEILIAGDVKYRNVRGLILKINYDYVQNMKKELNLK
jgi:predicted phosphoadenosine phosphosulfate sulfurtransferase